MEKKVIEEIKDYYNKWAPGIEIINIDIKEPRILDEMLIEY